MSPVITLDLITWDVTPATVSDGTASQPSNNARSYTERIAATIEDSYSTGADIVLLPEFTWLGMERFVSGQQSSLRATADLFWQEEFAYLQQHLARPGRAVVLGTCPFHDPTSGSLRNRAPILRDGDVLHQDKLHLTPWETAFTAGDTVRLFTFKNLTIAVIICLDIEVPELSALLRGRGVDLILCPSATETVLGVERVDRCASARAVELGCHVGVSHLLGKSPSELIDENVGRVAIYHPSQVPFAKIPRWEEGPIQTQGVHCLRVVMDPRQLKRMRARTAETNPSLLAIPTSAKYRTVTLE